MKIRKNQTAITVHGIGEVLVEPIQLSKTYFSPNRTHGRRFEFEAEGREYWGEVRRNYSPELPHGQRVWYWVELLTRNQRTGHGVMVAEKAKPAWREALINHLRDQITG